MRLAVQPLRLGFAGVGWIGRHRLAAVRGSGLAAVAAVCDPDAGARDRCREVAPDCAVTADFDELLAHPIDGVVIATPSAAHARQALRALERGLPVFCQKPLARTAAEARAVIAAARERDLLLGVDLCYRTLAGIDRLRAAIGSGAIGEVFAVEAAFHNAYGPDKPWFYDHAAAGGGCFMDLGVHLVDLVLHLLHGPEVTGVTRRLFREGRPLPIAPSEVEDYAEVQLELDGAAVARIATSWRLHAGRDAVIELGIYGTRGGALLRNVGGSFFDFEVELANGTHVERLASPPDDWGGRAITAWARALAGGAGFDLGIEDHLAVARVIDEVYDR